MELKNSNVRLRNAFEDNLRSYRHDIAQLFHCNAFCMLSNALETRVGSFTAGWEHFFNWFRVDCEQEAVNRKEITKQATSLEHAADGLCEKARLLDYVENFILFHKGETKIIAQRLLEGHPKVLVQDWWKDGQTQRAVKAAIEEVLDKDLPES